MKRIIFLLFLLYINILAISIGDENGELINSGDNVYIYSTRRIDNFSIDVEREYFKFVSIKENYNNIYIGKLKNNIEPGTEIILNLYCADFNKAFKFKIIPDFSDILLYEKILKKGDTLKGNIIFKDYKNITNGNGIDSLFLFIESFDNKIISKHNIYKVDSLFDFDYASGIFPINIPLLFDTGHYAVSLIIFSNSMFDTIKQHTGFVINNKITNNAYNSIIVDANNYSEMINLYKNYFQTNSNFYFTFFSGAKVYNNSKINCYILGEFSIYQNSIFDLLNNTHNYNIIFFPKFKYLLNDSIFQDTISKLLEFDIDTQYFHKIDNTNFYGFDINNQYEHYYIKNDSLLPYIKINNCFIFFFIPEHIDFDVLEMIISNNKNTLLHKLLGRFNAIETLNNKGYNNYTIEFYTVYGKYLNALQLNFTYLGDIIININKFAKMNDIKKNIVFYRITKDEFCIKHGIFYQ